MQQRWVGDLTVSTPGHQQGQGWVPTLLLGEIRDDKTVVPRSIRENNEGLLSWRSGLGAHGVSVTAQLCSAVSTWGQLLSPRGKNTDRQR